MNRGLDYKSFLLLLEQEAQQRDEKAQRRRLWAARFPVAKSLDDFDMISRLPNVSEASI